MSHEDLGESTATSSSYVACELDRPVWDVPTTGTSQSRPGPLAASGVNVTTRAVLDSEDEHIRLLKKLEVSVESFRGGKVSKTDAISGVLAILRENSHVSLTQSQKEATFDSYLTEILSIQSTFDQSSRNQDPSGSVPECPSTLDLAVKSKGETRARGDGYSDSENGDGKPSKRSKLSEADMPWNTASDAFTANSSDPSGQETCRLL